MALAASMHGMSLNASEAGATNYSIPDTGIFNGVQLANNNLAARTQYAAPTVPPNRDLPANYATAGIGHGLTQAPEYYNYEGGLPVKYDIPSAEKERMQARQAIRQAASKEPRDDKANVIRTDPITEGEVDYLQSMKAQAELADFDRYFEKWADPRKPGGMQFIMEKYPQYVDRRVKQAQTDYEFAMRNQMIDSWGAQSFDDIHFKYLVDNKKIDGPRLAKHVSLSDFYAPGLLSPWAFVDKRDGLHLPFASARFGRRPANRDDWRLSDEGQPLSSGRDTQALADSMYKYPGYNGLSATSRRPTMAGSY